MLDIEKVKQMCANCSLRETNHFMVRLLQRGISLRDVMNALAGGEIIEQYPNDYPYPSCLVLGVTEEREPLHVVCGIGAGELWLITAYCPDMTEWSKDFRIRKGDA